MQKLPGEIRRKRGRLMIGVGDCYIQRGGDPLCRYCWGHVLVGSPYVRIYLNGRWQYFHEACFMAPFRALVSEASAIVTSKRHARAE